MLLTPVRVTQKKVRANRYITGRTLLRTMGKPIWIQNCRLCWRQCNSLRMQYRKGIHLTTPRNRKMEQRYRTHFHRYWHTQWSKDTAKVRWSWSKWFAYRKQI